MYEETLSLSYCAIVNSKNNIGIQHNECLLDKEHRKAQLIFIV
jgi:hypothetical protein